MLKELPVKEALILLAEKYPEPVDGHFWDMDDIAKSGILLAVQTSKDFPFRLNGGNYFKHFAIEVPEEYRYMTQQECIDWVCLNAHKGYQVNFKRIKDDWSHAFDWVYDEPESMEYRTIQEIDGKIVYGEPQEFKVKV